MSSRPSQYSPPACRDRLDVLAVLDVVPDPLRLSIAPACHGSKSAGLPSAVGGILALASSIDCLCSIDGLCSMDALSQLDGREHERRAPGPDEIETRWAIGLKEH